MCGSAQIEEAAMFLFQLLNVGERFRQHFEVVPAFTSDLRDQVFRIRHNVYCEELGLEPVRRDWRETDEYDSHSLHCLLRNVKTGEFAACARLIRAGPFDLLPIEKYATAALDTTIVDPQTLPRESIGEISRFAVMRKYRRRRSDDESLIGLTDESLSDGHAPRFPFIAVGLALALIELALRHGVHTLFALAEPRLPDHFAKLGVKVLVVGTPVEGRGLRVPSMIDCQAIVEGLNFAMRPLYQVIAAEVDRGLNRP
jgi:N-acyl amino acid synthase of PEP-CTERM/exosortase system